VDDRRIDEILERTLDDEKLSRGERDAIRAILDDTMSAAGTRSSAGFVARVRRRAFDVACRRMSDPRDARVVEWLDAMLRAIDPQEDGSDGRAAREGENLAFFSPGDDCLTAIQTFIRRARKTLDLCVFTITDDRIAREIEASARRGVRVRIITDNEKSEDLGSDIDGLAQRGIPVVVDESEKHMHHKFAIGDDVTILTGSYNWTRAAAIVNEENIVVSDDRGLVLAFRAEFDRLWTRLSGA
jgi:cardiolipin hydrolase